MRTLPLDLRSLMISLTARYMLQEEIGLTPTLWYEISTGQRQALLQHLQKRTGKDPREMTDGQLNAYLQTKLSPKKRA